MKPTRQCLLVPASITVSLLTGALAGWYFTLKHHKNTAPDSARVTRKMDGGAAHREIMFTHIRAERIEDNLRFLSSAPRVAGSDHNHIMAEWLVQQWNDMGLDKAGMEEYEVLLTYPSNDSRYNRVEIFDEEEELKYVSPKYEKKLDPYQIHNDRIPPYAPYSRSGVVQGDVVYVNHCTEEDIMLIRSNFNIDLKGKILMARHGGIPAYKKADIANKHGAIGLLLFTHPFIEASKGPEKVYPHTKSLPETGVRRASLIGKLGDPLTQGYPAKEFSPRLSIEEAESRYMASIPVHPINYNTARQLFKAMDYDSPEIPLEWKKWNEFVRFPKTREDLEHEFNFYPRIGGRMRRGHTVRLSVNNTLEKRKIYNTHGVIIGSEEPDRFVVVGNHRDTWGYGAVDPGGGSAVLLELSTALSAMLKQGWRPRRTIILSSWDAEEFGVIGSTEWVEDKMKILMHKAVAYINIDIAVLGSQLLVAAASPLLHSLIFEATAKVSHPKFPTLFDAWRNESIMHSFQIPKVEKLTPNSDFSPFFFTAGIPSANIYYGNPRGQGYPTYHTAYDTFHYVKKFIDPDFSLHRSVTQLYGEMLRRLAEDEIIPLDARRYAAELQEALKWIRVWLHFSEQLKWLKDEGNLMKRLEASVANFTAATEIFHKQLDDIDINRPLLLRAFNDRLMLMERAFIDQEWGAGTPLKHILWSPERKGVQIFGIGPGINDVLSEPEFQQYSNGTYMPSHLYRQIRDEFAKLCFAIDTAAEILMV